MNKFVAEAVEREQWIRRVVQFGSIAAGVLLIVGVSFSYVWQSQRERLVVESVERLKDATQEVETGAVFDDPDFYADNTVCSQGFGKTVVQIGTKCVQRHTAFAIPFRTGDVSTTQTS